MRKLGRFVAIISVVLGLALALAPAAEARKPQRNKRAAVRKDPAGWPGQGKGSTPRGRLSGLKVAAVEQLDDHEVPGSRLRR